ncbi:ubiquinone-dependent pyruvate dehydrogenase [Streptomyces sp. NPDC047061]|uniref:ubiquinone-dependent pyruvate dehydrogenase n=1 Tax=Streptomyces sp. NPDC047061 TaxID=3154605 RepID=UPI0033D37D15
MTSVAHAVVAHLQASGVRRVYGLPGESLSGFTDALRRAGDIRWVHVRHEETAALAAAAEAALTGQLAVCAASCGPGNTHLVNGLYDAARSRVPVLVIAAHIPSEEIGSQYFQETHPQELFRETAVYCELIGNAAQLPRVLSIAMRTAVNKEGPAVVIVPGDILLADAADREPATPVLRSASVIRPVHDELAAAAATLNSAGRVTILAGAGCAGAHGELVEAARVLKAPVVHTLRGKEHVEYDNAYDVGMTGLLGFSSGYRAMESCDALLVLGADFPYRDFYPPGVPVVQVDIRGEQIGRRIAVRHSLAGTVKDTLCALLPLLSTKRSSHLRRMRDHYARTRRELARLAAADHDRAPLHPQCVATTVDEEASGDAVFIPDGGSPIIWAARQLKMNGRRRLIGSFNHGTVANAIPHAIGAQSACPGRQVIALSGDGGIAVLLGDLITLRQHDLPVKIVVFDNEALAFAEQAMAADDIPPFGTKLSNPDFAAVARAMGIHGIRVEHPSGLRPALREAFDHPGPALVDVRTAQQKLSVPPYVTRGRGKGKSLFEGRLILSGRGDELMDPAQENIMHRVLS